MKVRGKRGWWDGRVNRCLKRFYSPTGTCACVSVRNENILFLSLSWTYTHFTEWPHLAEKSEVRLKSGIQQQSFDLGYISINGSNFCLIQWIIVFLNLAHKRKLSKRQHQIKQKLLIKDSLVPQKDLATITGYICLAIMGCLHVHTCKKRGF